MNRDSINEEISLCNSILNKFKEELSDCKKDYDTLKELESRDKDRPEFKKAFMAVKERHDDITLSVKLIKNRLEELNRQLESAN